MHYLALFAHEGCLAVFLVDVYSNVDCHSLFHLRSFLGWLERGNHLFARQERIQGAAPEVCPFTHPTETWSVGLRAYQPRRTYTGEA